MGELLDLIYGGLSARALGLSVCTREETPVKTLVRAEAVSDRTALGVAAVYGTREEAATRSFVLASDCPVESGLAAAVADWLSPGDYRELTLDDGREGKMYRARVAELSSTSVGGETRFFTVTFELAYPHALGAKRSLTIVSTSAKEGTAVVLTAGKYAYPKLSVTGLGTVALNNLTDDAARGAARPFSLAGLTSGETITADCRRRTLATNLTRTVNAAFTGDWPRLLRGENVLRVTGIGTVTLTWRESAAI